MRRACRALTMGLQLLRSTHPRKVRFLPRRWSNGNQSGHDSVTVVWFDLPLGSPSSRGLGRGPFKAKTRVRIPVGTPAFANRSLRSQLRLGQPATEPRIRTERSRRLV